MSEAFDLVIRGGRLIDPGQGLDGLFDVGLRDGKIAAIEPLGRLGVEQCRSVFDASGLLVTPGLVDLHVHGAFGVGTLGVDIDRTCLCRGTTTGKAERVGLGVHFNGTSSFGSRFVACKMYRTERRGK